MEYIFVYGTLLRENLNSVGKFFTLYTSEVGKGYFHGQLYDLGEYPAAIKSEDKSQEVKGKVFVIKDSSRLFEILDDYEGAGENREVDNEYIREKVKVYLETGEKIVAWTYLYAGNPKGLKKIETGDYISYLEKK